MICIDISAELASAFWGIEHFPFPRFSKLLENGNAHLNTSCLLSANDDIKFLIVETLSQ